MQYILIDNFNGNINIVLKDDGSGETLIFDNLKDAEEACDEYCQNGQVIPLGVDIIKVFEDCEEFISMAVDEGFVDDELTKTLDEILDLK